MADINLENSLAVLLIGRAGNGKSSTGNTIIGKDDFFASSDTESSTKLAQYEYCEFEGKVLKVVDCPGLGDTRVGVGVDVEQLTEAIKTSFEMNPKGFNAIIYILKFANKFDHYDVQALTVIKQVVGEDFIKKHCILLMTRGDCFETDRDVISHKLSFDEWVERQKDNRHFRKLLEECDGRIILFNNRATDVNKKEEQMRKLVELIKRLGDRYTNTCFQDAAIKRTQLLVRLHNEEETLSFIDRLSVLGSRIKNASNDKEGWTTLRLAENDYRILKEEADRAKDKKRIVRDAMILFNLIEECLSAKKDQVNTTIDFPKEKEEIKGSKTTLGAGPMSKTKRKIDAFEKKYLQIKTKIMGGFYSPNGQGLFGRVRDWFIR